MKDKKYKIVFFTLLFSVLSIFISNASTNSQITNEQPSIVYLLLFLLRSVVGMLLLPILFIKFYLKRELGDFGFRLPVNKKKALLTTGLFILGVIPILLIFSANSDFQSMYSYGDVSLYKVFLQMIVLSAIYYIAEEFMFRGFLLFSLKETFGYTGILYVNIIFMLFHFAKPLPEIAFAFFSGLAFSYLAVRFKSFVPAAIAHYIIAVILNIIIYL